MSGASQVRRKKVVTDYEGTGGAGKAWDEDLSADGYEYDGDDPYNDDRAMAMPGRKVRPAKKSAASIPWTRVIFVALAVFCFAAFGATIYFFAGPLLNSLGSLAGGSLADDIAMLPENAVGVVHVQVEDLLKYENDYAFLKSNPLTEMYSGSSESDAREFAGSIRSLTISIPGDKATQSGGIARSPAAGNLGEPFIVMR